ncbi:hypothetical protein HDV05_007914 [Chytridiales sp. JEL 0842]|nr:hypothetical protein HDV05_007914 [Chytridiales sp. JEL 0842]
MSIFGNTKKVATPEPIRKATLYSDSSQKPRAVLPIPGMTSTSSIGEDGTMYEQRYEEPLAAPGLPPRPNSVQSNYAPSLPPRKQPMSIDASFNDVSMAETSSSAASTISRKNPALEESSSSLDLRQVRGTSEKSQNVWKSMR